jgi:type II secretory pathway component PulK
MRAKLYKIIQKENGAALISVLLLFAVLMIFTASLSVLFVGNLKQTKRQEQKMEAYYLALSGIDMSLSALLNADENHAYPLLDEYKWNQEENPDIVADLASKQYLNQTDVLTLENGTVSINIRPINNENKSVREVEIHAVGTLSNTGVTNALTLVIEADNPQVQRWE